VTSKPLTASLRELAGPVLTRITHPTTGQELVPVPAEERRRRLVRGPAFLLRGKPANLLWAEEQAKKMAAKGRSPARIAELFAKVEMTRGDGSPVTPQDVEKWLCVD
jgi:hypothetical protein